MVYFAMGSFQMDFAGPQTGLGIIGIKRNRALVVSVSYHLTTHSDQLAEARNPKLILTDKPFSWRWVPEKSESVKLALGRRFRVERPIKQRSTPSMARPQLWSEVEH